MPTIGSNLQFGGDDLTLDTDLLNNLPTRQN